MKIALAVPVLTILSWPSAAAAQPTEEGQQRQRQNSAAQVARDGTFLPFTLSARVGDQYVAGMALGGYDSAEGEGGRANAFVEGALFNRVALRVTFDYASLQEEPIFGAGLRMGLLRQEQHRIDLGFVAQYKNHGFSESRGEIELMVTLGRRWNKFGLFGDLVYGQGFEEQERDGEVRLAFLYAAHERVNVGLDARARFDLGEGAAATAGKPGVPFDLVVGPVASASVGPVAFLAHAGVHTILFEGSGGESSSVGAIVLAGVGATY